MIKMSNDVMLIMIDYLNDFIKRCDCEPFNEGARCMIFELKIKLKQLNEQEGSENNG